MLSLEAALKEYPQKGLEDLAQLLIDDLTPYIGVRALDYGTIDNFDSRKMFLPRRYGIGATCIFSWDVMRKLLRHITV